MSSQNFEPSEPITSLKELYQRLLQLQQNGAHIITPFVIQDIPAKHVPVLIPVMVDPNPDNGDVYPTAGGRFSLGRNPLRRIEQALGIDWDARPGMTGRVDNGSSADYIHYKAVGYCPMPDGTRKTFLGEKEIRVELLLEEAVEKQRKDLRKRQADPKEAEELKRDYPTPESMEARVQEKARVEILQIKKHLLPRAATGAKCIAVKSLGVRESYLKEELAHPFIVLKLQARLDMNDPEDAALIRAQALGMIEALYRGRLPLPSEKEPIAIEHQPVQDSLTVFNGTAPMTQVVSPPVMAPPPSVDPPKVAPLVEPEQPKATEPPVSNIDALFRDFKTLSAKEQAQHLERLVKTVEPHRANAYTASRIERWSEHARLSFYREQMGKAQKVVGAV